MDNEPLFESKKSKQYLLVKFKSSIKLYEKSGVHAAAYDHWKGEDSIQVIELTTGELEQRLLGEGNGSINVNVEPGGEGWEKVKNNVYEFLEDEKDLFYHGFHTDNTSDNEISEEGL